MHLVTVYVTTKNRLTFLRRCLDSLFKQTYSNIEIIVVDDGSNDGTHEYLKELEDDKKLIAILNKKSLGACAARNLAIERSKGLYITGIDDDDYMEPWRVKSFLDYMSALEEQSEPVLGLFDDTVLEFENRRETLVRHDSVTYSDLRKENLIGNQIFVAAEKLKVESFDPDMPALQDWDTWLRLAKKFEGKYFNIHQGSYIQDVGHDAGRITLKRKSVLEDAFSKLFYKLGEITLQERVSLIITKYNYPQMKLGFSDIYYLLITGHCRKGLSAIKKRFVN
ncbi:Glycosyl transferase [Alteromonas alvinellae]